MNKIIELIIGEKVKKNKTSTKDYIKGILSTICLLLFSIDPKMLFSTEGNTSEKKDSKIYLGYILIFTGLTVDALLSLKEKLISKQVEDHPSLSEYKHMISWYTMYILNLSILIISTPLYSKCLFDLL